MGNDSVERVLKHYRRLHVARLEKPPRRRDLDPVLGRTLIRLCGDAETAIGILKVIGWSGPARSNRLARLLFGTRFGGSRLSWWNGIFGSFDRKLAPRALFLGKSDRRGMGFFDRSAASGPARRAERGRTRCRERGGARNNH